MATNDVNELIQKIGNLDIETSSTKLVLNIPVYVKNETKQVPFTLQDLLNFPYRTFNINMKQKESQTWPSLESSFFRSSRNYKTNVSIEYEYVIEKKTGYIDIFEEDMEKDIFEDEENNESKSTKVEEILRLLEVSAFEEAHKKLADDALFVVFGLNRPRSLSRLKNNLLKKELQIKSDFKNHRKFAFFWNFQWTDNYGNKVDYSIIQAYYKDLKGQKMVKKKQPNS